MPLPIITALQLGANDVRLVVLTIFSMLLRTFSPPAYVFAVLPLRVKFPDPRLRLFVALALFCEMTFGRVSTIPGLKNIDHIMEKREKQRMTSFSFYISIAAHTPLI